MLSGNLLMNLSVTDHTDKHTKTQYSIQNQIYDYAEKRRKTKQQKEAAGGGKDWKISFRGVENEWRRGRGRQTDSDWKMKRRRWRNKLVLKLEKNVLLICSCFVYLHVFCCSVLSPQGRCVKELTTPKQSECKQEEKSGQEASKCSSSAFTDGLWLAAVPQIHRPIT